MVHPRIPSISHVVYLVNHLPFAAALRQPKLGQFCALPAPPCGWSVGDGG